MVGSSVLFCAALLLALPDQSIQYGHSAASISGSNAQSYSSASASSFASSFSSSGSFSGSGSNAISGSGLLDGLGSAGASALAGAASFANAGAQAGAHAGIPAFGASYSGTKGGGSSHKAQAILKKNGLGVGGGIGLGQSDTLLGTSDFGSAAIKANCHGKPCTQLTPELGTGHLPLDNGPEALESGGLSEYENKKGIGPFKPNGYSIKTNSGAGVGGGIGIGAADTFLGGGVKVNGGCGPSGCGSDIKPIVEDNPEQGGGVSCVGVACLQHIPQNNQDKPDCKNGGCSPDALHFPGEIGGSYGSHPKPGSTGYATGNVVVHKPGHPDTSIHFQTSPDNVHGISSSVSGGVSSDGPGFATGSVHITKPGGGSTHHTIPSTSHGSGNVYASKPIGCGQNSDCSDNVQISYPTVPGVNGPNENQPSYTPGQSCGPNGVGCGASSGLSGPSPNCGPGGCGTSSGGSSSYPSGNGPKDNQPSYTPGQSCGPNGIGCGPSNGSPSSNCGPSGCDASSSGSPSYSSGSSSCGPSGCGPANTYPSQPSQPSCGPGGCAQDEKPQLPIESNPSCGPNGCGPKETSPLQPSAPSPSTPQCGGAYGGSCSQRPSTELEVPFQKPGAGSQYNPSTPNYQSPTPYSPSSGTHSVPSNAIPADGVHYTGPFPGPQGSIHESKPATKPGPGGLPPVQHQQQHVPNQPQVPSQPSYQPLNPTVPQPGPSVPTSPGYKPGEHSPAQKPGGSQYTGPFPGPSGSIHESRPAGVKPGAPQHPPVPTVPAYNPSVPSGSQTLQHHPVPSVPSYTPSTSATAGSTASADAGAHYTGPFPGPSGSIHASKPAAGKPGHPAPTTAYSGTTAGTQYTGSTGTKPVEPTYTSAPQPSTTSSTSYTGAIATSTADAEAGVHYSGPFPGPTGSIHSSKPAKGYNPQNQPLSTVPTQYPSSTAGATAGANAGTHTGSPTSSVPTGGYTTQNQPTTSTQYSTSTANANANAGANAVPTRPSTGSYGSKTKPEVETDKPIVHIIPTSPSYESPKIDSNLVPGVTPEISVGASDVNVGPSTTVSTGCSGGICGQAPYTPGCTGSSCGNKPGGATPDISFGGISGAGAGSAAGATVGSGCSGGGCGQGSYSGSQPSGSYSSGGAGCSSGNCGQGSYSGSNPTGSYSSGSKGGCGGASCGTGSQPIGIQIPGLGISGSFSSAGSGAHAGGQGCGPACAGLQGLANAFGNAFAGSGSYSGVKGGSAAKAGAYASSGASAGSIGVPSGHAGGSFASSFASAGASAHAGGYSG